MKLACFADLHGHIFREFDEKSDKTGSTRLDKIVDTILNMGIYCINNSIKHVLFAGDLYHVRKKIDIIAYNAIYEAIDFLSNKGLNFIMIPGNHDDTDNSDIPQSSLLPFSNIRNVTVFNSCNSIEISEDNEVIHIDCVPFSKNTQMIKDYLNEVTSTHVKNSILLMHAGVTGANVGENSYILQDAFKLEDLHPEYYKYIVLGHYHKRQFLGGTNHAFYCGSPIQHSFNDEGEDKGFYIIDTNKKYDVEFVPLQNPKFHTVSASVSTEDLQTYASNGDYLRVQLKEDEVQDFVSRVPVDLKYRIDLQKDYQPEDTRSDVKIGMSFEDIIRQYAKEYNPEALDIGLEILHEVEGK